MVYRLNQFGAQIFFFHRELVQVLRRPRLRIRMSHLTCQQGLMSLLLI